MRKGKIGLLRFCLLVSVFSLVAYNLPFLHRLLGHLEGGFNAVLLALSAVLLLLATCFFGTALLLFAGRKAGKVLLSFFLTANAVALYFINGYDVLITDTMMGNFFHTQYSEASGFFSAGFAAYVLLLGVLPSVYVCLRRIDYGPWRRFLGMEASALLLVLALVFGNMKNWPWIDRHSTELGALVLPWSYTVNSVRYWQSERQRNAREIPLPDPQLCTDTPDVCVLIIGESARRDHFSLYGYGKETNPYTAGDSVTVFPADAAATYTLAGVRAILSPFRSRELYEILPNYLQRAGVDVSWRSSNWGEPPVHSGKYYRKKDLKARFPEADERYDGILLAGLREDIAASDSSKVFVVLHTYTNHGPAYAGNYPPEFEVFTPVCRTVEMSKAVPEELMNAYDNSVVYTDYLIHSAIEVLKSLEGRSGCVLYVSDHGESLGENHLYMHGVPMSMAPREQIEIPFIVWAPDRPTRDLPAVGQYHVFHSVLDFLGVCSETFDKEMSIFK